MANKESQKERIERLKRRNDFIEKRFKKLNAKMYKDKTKLYSQETILEMLSEEFHLSTRTIDDILCGRVNY